MECEVPFRVNDYVIGFKHSIRDLVKAPHTFFLKRVFDSKDTKIRVRGEYNNADKIMKMSSIFEHEKYGLTVLADGDTRNYLTKFSVEATNDDFNSCTISKCL